MVSIFNMMNNANNATNVNKISLSLFLKTFNLEKKNNSQQQMRSAVMKISDILLKHIIFHPTSGSLSYLGYTAKKGNQVYYSVFFPVILSNSAFASVVTVIGSCFFIYGVGKLFKKFWGNNNNMPEATDTTPTAVVKEKDLLNKNPNEIRIVDKDDLQEELFKMDHILSLILEYERLAVH